MMSLLPPPPSLELGQLAAQISQTPAPLVLYSQTQQQPPRPRPQQPPTTTTTPAPQPVTAAAAAFLAQQYAAGGIIPPWAFFAPPPSLTLKPTAAAAPPAPTPAPTTTAPAPTPAPTTAAPAPTPTQTSSSRGGRTTAGMTLFRAGDSGLGIEGKEIAPVVTKAGIPAYEVRLKKGLIHGKGSNMYCNLTPRAFFPSEQCRFAFKVWFDDNFPWGDEMKKVGGKLLGFRIGKGDAQGGDYSPTGASFRMTWARHGGVGPYLYPQVRGGFSKKKSGGNISWDKLDQSKEVQAVSDIASGVHMFYPKDKGKKGGIENWDLRLHKGKWNDIEMFCKLNTPGRKDGVLEVTVNGVKKVLSTVRYRYDTSKIEQIKISTFFGGSTKEYAPPQDTRLWFADFAFSRA